MTTSAPFPETPSTLPSPPFVHLQGISNFRDIGGYSTSNGSESVRKGYMFRCAEPSLATDEAIAKIRNLGVTHIFDLRTNPEIAKFQVSDSTSPISNWPGIERIYNPVIPEEGFTPANMEARHAEYRDRSMEKMVNAYRTTLNQGATAYSKIMRHILQYPPPQNAFILHCTAGKDRTGMFCALILSLCGVPDEIVSEEYALTQLGNASWIDSLVQAIVTQTGSSEEDARWMTGARKESMQAALEMLKNEFGGAEGYFTKSCGFSSEEVNQIKELLTIKS